MTHDRRSTTAVLLLFALLASGPAAFGAVAAAAAVADDDASWTQWRGPLGTGFAPNGDPPVEWSETRNVKWKVAIPGEGHASPVVLGDRIYVTTAIRTAKMDASEADRAERAEEQRQARRRGRGRNTAPRTYHQFLVLAIDRADGSIVWRRMVSEQVPHEGIHRTGTFAGGSPITDGKNVYAFFGSRGLYCLDLDGTVKWQKDLGDMSIRNSFGEGASPALYGDTLVVPWDHEGDSFVAAFDKSTGSEKWRVARNERTTWTTPVVVEVNGAPQAVVAGTTATVAYDLATGAEIWRCSGMTGNVVPTPVVNDGVIYVMSGFRGAALQAIKLADAKGDITGSDALLWTHDRGTPYIPSPVLSGRNLLYFIKGTGGMVSCLDAKTGEVRYGEERLAGAESVYSSPVAVAGRIYISGREGDTVVLEDGPELKILATNSIGEGIDATPAIVGDEIYLRGSEHLFCIARPERE